MDITTQMDSAQTACSALAGFLANYIENQEHQLVYAGSHSGHIARLQFNATVTEAIMIIARLWDRCPDGWTIHALYEFSEASNLENSDEHRRNRNCAILDRVKRSMSDTLQSEPFLAIRAYRTDWIAHMLPSGGRDRRAYSDRFGPYARPSYTNIIDLLDCTAQIISDLRYAALRERHNPSDTRKLYYDYASAYWQAMPVFREVEQLP